MPFEATDIKNDPSKINYSYRYFNSPWDSKFEKILET